MSHCVTPPPPCFYFFWVPKKWETGEHSKLFRSGKGGIMQISFPIFSAEACRDKKSWFVSIQINRRRGGFRAAFLGRNGSSFFCSSYSLAILHTCTQAQLENSPSKIGIWDPFSRILVIFSPLPFFPSIKIGENGRPSGIFFSRPPTRRG